MRFINYFELLVIQLRKRAPEMHGNIKKDERRKPIGFKKYELETTG